MSFDFGIDDSGELLFDNTSKDVRKREKLSLRRQIALCRIKSVTGDWFNTNIGADLEEFIGYKCNEDTANEIIESIETALSYDDFMQKEELFFIPQIELNTISILVFIKDLDNESPATINVRIDIVGGVKVQYEPY